MKRRLTRLLRLKPMSLLKKLSPVSNLVTRSLLLSGLLLLGTSALAFAQSGTGIPILDGILDFIQTYKGGLAMVGVGVLGAGLLTKLFAPDWSRDHKPAFVSMIVGGIVLSMVGDIAALIVG